MKKTFILFIITAALVIFSKFDTLALSSNLFEKTDLSVSDEAINAFSEYYEMYIPKSLKKSYESDGGLFYITPHNYVRTDINMSGWSSGDLSKVTGFIDPNGTVPVIYLNSKVVDNSYKYNPRTDEKVILHEFGHYVNLKANQIRNGSFSYELEENVIEAFENESNNIKYDNKLQIALHDSFLRNTGNSEFYANIFAGLLIDPVNTKDLFPLSSKAVLEDCVAIYSVYMD